MILILEDDAVRLRRFATAVVAIDPGLRLLHWPDAWTMIRQVGQHLPATRLISLDHDLEPQTPCSDDPGDGLDVAKYLAALRPTCPVIIHSSNGQGSLWMAGEFELGGWKAYRVAPIGEDWIEQDWRRLAKRLLRRRPYVAADPHAQGPLPVQPAPPE